MNQKEFNLAEINYECYVFGALLDEMHGSYCEDCGYHIDSGCQGICKSCELGD